MALNVDILERLFKTLHWRQAAQYIADNAGGGGGGYASLTGAGTSTTPGDLTQAGGFTINDTVSDGINLNSNGPGGAVSLSCIDPTAFGMSLQSAGGTSILDTSTSGITIEANGGAVNVVISGSSVVLNSAGVTVTTTHNVILSGLPTTNPGGTGRVWNNSGVLNIT